jgi:hypothetical protein
MAGLQKAAKRRVKESDKAPVPPMSWLTFTKNFIHTSPDYNDYDAVLDTVIRSNCLTNLHYTKYTYIVSNDYNENVDKNSKITRIEKDIYFDIVDSKVMEKTGDIQILTYRIHAKHHNLEFIKSFVDRCREAYCINVNDKLGHDHVYFFDHVIPENYENVDKVIFEQGKFESNKTFDNLFYPEKGIVHNRVKHFINDSDWYKDKGIPHMLGFMFHGLPGTGKTSTIKAIANLTKRHIINVRLSEVKTKTCLKNLFCNETLSLVNTSNNQLEKVRVPIKKRLYVIEDIDAMSDLIRKREFQHAELEQKYNEIEDKQAANNKKTGENKDIFNPGSSDWGKTEDECEGGDLDDYLTNAMHQEEYEMNQDQKRKRNRDKVTFADILNILDGTLEIPGRMICFTTNHLEIIDDALIRPGRIDMIIEFILADCDDIKRMFEKFYDLDMEKSLFSEVKDHTVSHAQINQIMFKHLTDPDAALHEVTVLSNKEGLTVSKSSKKEFFVPKNKRDLVAKNSKRRAVVKKKVAVIKNHHDDSEDEDFSDLDVELSEEEEEEEDDVPRVRRKRVSKI